jgi:sugar-specific transcriptional regulator TrmB
MAPKRENETSPPPPELVTSFRPETATPVQVEELIDFRIQKLDEEIAELQRHIEDLKEERKRWVTVTGGRSRAREEA